MNKNCGLFVVALTASLSCGGTPSASKQATTNATMAKATGAWTAQQTAELIAECDRAFVAIDETALKSCYGENFESELVNEVFPEIFPNEIGPRVHLEDANQFAAFFDGPRESQLLIATPTRAVQIYLHQATIKSEFPFEAAHGKSLKLATAKLTRLDDKGRLVSELIFRDQGAFGNQTGVYKNPMASAPFEKREAAVVAVSTGSSAEAANLQIVRDANKAYISGDGDTRVGYFAETVRSWTPLNASASQTRADIKKATVRMRTGFKEIKQGVVEEFAAGDWVVRVMSTDAVIADEGIPNMPQTAGTSLGLTELHIERLENGLIRERYGFYNTLSLQVQLGLFDRTETLELLKAAQAEKATKNGKIE